MKRKYLFSHRGSLLMLIAALLFTFKTFAQENFQVKWSMDYTQAGVSSHANFTPANASLMGGANTYTLPNVYSPGDAIVAGYLTRPWPPSFSPARCMEFTFTANSFKYNISSISFRLRRSGEGARQIRVRSGMDNFAADLGSFTIVAPNQFNSYTIPVNFANLTDNTFSLRIFGSNPDSIYGTLWFDEIIINGQVLAIILPIELTYFKAKQNEKAMQLSWETIWEKNSKEFVIERSPDLKQFHAIGTVDASGETAGRTWYEYDDQNPIAGVSYYRLRMTDRDGSFALSKVIDANMQDDADFLQVQPILHLLKKLQFRGKISI
ncbi:hypothetical protein [Dyadobacter sp. CY323]|uniref:hypothetical protein n=1 Tax=Dyadobacter sp. CY323 TaxID=2907302 RepID=UPI001F2D117B|nr:hypothetical protein [Dyadobacter sp. CY323]MCE6988589.1 hypothetical protein [Dyadobacter sp. CY323]